MVVLTSFPPPTNGIKHRQPETIVRVNNREIGKGTLFITESCLSWVNTASGQGFSLEYPHICLHAVSRDLTAHPQECLYIMIDTKLEDHDSELQPANDSEDEDDDEEEGTGMTEMSFIPDDKGMLDAMFLAMSECQALHPDPNDSVSGESDIYDEGEYCIPNAVESMGLMSEAGDAPKHPDENGQNGSNQPMETDDADSSQFEDAEEEHDM